jgi:hypothetical protein
MAGSRHKLLGVLGAEIALFAVASLAHRGHLIRGYEHAKAANAETVIAVVLAVGLVVCLARPNFTRAAALWTQGFALLGVTVGLAMIAIGVGPRTGPDLALHALMLVALVLGLMIARPLTAALTLH